MTKHVRIYKRGDRGFHGYGKPFMDANGGRIEVYESSSAGGPHVWVEVDARAWGASTELVSAHLNAEQARALVSRLQTWLDEIPARWGRRK